MRRAGRALAALAAALWAVAVPAAARAQAQAVTDGTGWPLPQLLFAFFALAGLAVLLFVFFAIRWPEDPPRPRRPFH